MKKILITVLFSINVFYIAYAQDSCENNCGSGTLQEYWNNEVNCVCSLDCAGYGSACCDYYDVCYQNPSNLEFSDFVGTWNGNITNDQTWSYDDNITVVIEANNEYTVTNNPGWHLVSDSYPGTEEVHYNSSTNILTFQWVLYYHYACGGPCYTSVPFQVMDIEDGELTLFYNNGSGPAPQANSMFLTLEGWQPDLMGDLNGDEIIDILDLISLINMILDGEYSIVADLNEDGIINILDIVIYRNIILGN